PVQRRRDEAFQLGACDSDPRVASGQFRDQFGYRLRRQPLLGVAALLAQPGERPDRRGTRWVYATGVGEAVEGVVQQRLVDQVAGELRISGGVFDRLERRCGISQRDARAAATEV